MIMPGAPAHSITLSARASSVGGRVRPSTLAVLRLITHCRFGPSAPPSPAPADGLGEVLILGIDRRRLFFQSPLWPIYPKIERLNYSTALA